MREYKDRALTGPRPLLIACIAVFLALISAPNAQARELACVSQGYCVNDLTCNTNAAGNETLIVRILKGNRAQFGWSEDGLFEAEGIRKSGYTIYMSNIREKTTQTFVLAEDMTGSMGVTGMLGSDFYNSHHRLICKDVE